MATCQTAISILVMGVASYGLLGCGATDRVELGRVQGTVTYQGKPLDRGRVVFPPEPGTDGPQSVGAINADGSFEMRTGNDQGAPIGKHLVTVHCRQKRTPEQDRDVNFIPPSLIPEKYSKQDESPLRFEVKRSDNRYEVELE